uniref:hypothetical protein n=1 Tax=Jatropha curcas TaxID=180498 RepID=UPI0027A42BB6|nr:hypothetical protein QLP06_mgp067 [Jatropha curcas]WFG81172.1 hypothetical protein [Jatropha curcas]
MERKKRKAGCFLSSLPVSPLVDIRNWKGIPDHSDFRRNGIWMESRGKKESGFRGLINFVIMDHQQIPKCFFILSPRKRLPKPIPHPVSEQRPIKTLSVGNNSSGATFKSEGFISC